MPFKTFSTSWTIYIRSTWVMAFSFSTKHYSYLFSHSFQITVFILKIEMLLLVSSSGGQVSNMEVIIDNYNKIHVRSNSATRIQTFSPESIFIVKFFICLFLSHSLQNWSSKHVVIRPRKLKLFFPGALRSLKMPSISLTRRSLPEHLTLWISVTWEK